MKRKQLAVAAGISYPFLAEIENGKKWPSFVTLDVLTEALGCDSVYLLTRAKQIGENWPLPCDIALQHAEDCTCSVDAIVATSVKNGWRP